MRRGVRVAILAAVAAVVLAVAAIGVSAALDRPAEIAEAEVTIDAPRREVWAVLIDISRYDEWNTLVTSASGTLAEGQTLSLTLARAAGTDEAEAEVMNVNKGRKLRWSERLVVPGLRDDEFEIRLESDPTGGTVVRAHERVEGLFVPLVSIEERRRGLVAMLTALQRRVEGGGA
jgi:hypothetical protein